MSIGTRGDIEPFLAIGKLLHDKGHDILFSFPDQHSELVSKRFKFFPLSPKFIELLESEDGKILMGGKMKLTSKLPALYRLYKKGKMVNKLLVKQQHEIIESEKPDKIICNSKCSYPLIWCIKNAKKSIMISPVPYFIHEVKGHAHVGFNGNYEIWINKLTYKLANFTLVKMIKDASKDLPDKTFLNKTTIKKTLLSGKLIYTISPTLFPKPEYWPMNAQVLGHHAQKVNTEWTPSPELVNFLKNHKKVLFLTFGSMFNQSPEKTTRLLLETLNELNIPTIVNTASGGLIKLKDYDDNNLFHFESSIPYDWIFKKVYALIHHGGSGTTHLGLKNGCATLIIPHIIDQFAWNTLVKDIGAGPKGPSIGKLSKKKIKPLLIDLFKNKTYKAKAENISTRMNNENLNEDLYEFIMM